MPSATLDDPRDGRIGLIALLAAVTALGLGAVLGWDALRYMQVETYLDHAEPSVVARAWRLAGDLALYLPADHPLHQRTAYGPGLFITIHAALAAIGPSIAASKLAPVLAALATPALFLMIAWRRHGLERALLGAAGLLALQLALGGVAFWVRPDPFLLLATTLGLAAPLFGASWRSWMVAGACAGLAVTFKIHAFIYFLPLALGYFSKRWWLGWPTMAASALAVAILPFLLNGIALDDYLAHIRGVVGARGIVVEQVRAVLPKLGLYIGTPLVALFGLLAAGGRPQREDWLYGLGLMGAGLFYLYPASVPGGAWYHLAPLAPFVMDLALRLLGRDCPGRKGPALAAIVILIGLAATVSSTQRRLNRGWADMEVAARAADDVRRALRQAERPIEMGYGADNTSGYRLSYVAPLLTFAGDVPTVAGDFAMEATATNTALSPAKLERLSACAVRTWLIPKDNPPFALNNFMVEGPAFWPEWREAFETHYRKTGSIGVFDLWTCKASLH